MLCLIDITLNLQKFHDRNMSGAFAKEGGRAEANDGLLTRNDQADHGSLRTHTTVDINKQMRDLNQNSGSGTSQLPGGTLGKEEMNMRLRQANAGYQSQNQASAQKRAQTQEKLGGEGARRSGLKQPKKVSIIKNSNRDLLAQGGGVAAFGARGAGDGRSGERRNADLKSASSNERQKMVSFSAERPVQEYQSRPRPDRSNSKNSRQSTSQPRKKGSAYQHEYQANSGGKNIRDKSYGRSGRPTTFSNSRGAGNGERVRSNFNKNAQIQEKFKEQERDLHMVPDQGPSEFGIAAAAGGKSTKALISKMKQLGQKRKEIPGAAGGPPYSKKQIQEMYGSRPLRTGGPGGPGKPSQTMQQRIPTKNLQGEYDARTRKMNNRLNEEVNRNVIVPGAVRLKVKRPKNIYAEEEEDQQASESFQISEGVEHVDQEELYDLDLIPGHEYSPDKRGKGSQSKSNRKPKKDEKVVDYVRSKRAVEMRIRNEMTDDVASLDDDNTQLIQQLNHKLVELDRINEDKRDLSNQLIQQIQFVRDLQANLGTADNGNVADVIDKSMEDQFRQEKQRNIELKERLKAAELERTEVLEQLRILEGDKDVTVVSRQGREMNLEKAAMGVNELLRYKESVQRDAAQIEHDLDIFRADDEALHHMIIQLTRDAEATADERIHIAEDLRGLQRRYDDVIRQNECKLRDLAFDFRHRKRAMQGKVIYKALEKMVSLHLQGYFLDIKYQQKYEDQQISSIIAFRNLCFSYRERRQRKYLMVWFQKALKPLGTKFLAKSVTGWQTKHEHLRKLLLRWHHQQIIAATEKSYQIQSLQNFRQNFTNYHLRYYRYAFDLWKGETKKTLEGRDRLLKFARARMSMRQQEALYRWKNYCLRQEFHIKLNAQAVQLTALQYKSTLFYAWRTEAANLRSLRISLQLRVWKILNRHRQASKTNRKTSYYSSKNSDMNVMGLLEKTFNALRLNKEQEKRFKVYDALENDEKVQINEHGKQIKKIRYKADRSAKERAVKGAILNPFKKLLRMYWNHWSKATKDINILVNDKFKQLVIRVYKAKLTDVWARLQHKGAKKRRKMKMVMNEEMVQQNAAMEEDIRQTKEKVKSEEVRSFNKGTAKYKRLLLKAYRQELKHRLDQWKLQVENQNHAGGRLEKQLILKMKNRILKQAFDRFIAGAKRLRQIDRNQGRCIQIQEKLVMKQLRKVFNFFCANKQHQKEVRALTRQIFNNFNKKVGRHYFQRWQKYLEHKANKKLKKRQMMMTESTQGAIDAKGEAEDLTFEKVKKAKDMVRSGVSLSRKTLAKTISRWKRATVFAAFNTWKDRTKKFDEARSKIAHSVFSRLYHRRQRGAFATWRQNMHILSEKRKKFMSQSEIENAASQEDRISKSRTKIAQVRERSSRALDQLQEEQIYKHKLYKNQLHKIIQDRLNNYVINRTEHIFLTWRRIASHRARAIKLLQHNLRKNLLQHGLDCICVFDRQKQKRKIFLRKIRKMIQDYKDGRKRLALTLWKQVYFEYVCSRRQEFATKTYHTDLNSKYQRADIRQKRAGMFSQRPKARTLKACFMALADYRAKKRKQRARHQAFLERQRSLKIKKAIKRWGYVAHKQKIRKQYLKNFSGVSSRIIMKQVFDGLKTHRAQQLHFKKMLIQVYTNVSKEGKRFAFEQIRQKSLAKRMQFGSRADHIIRSTLHKALTWQRRTLKARFDQLYKNSKIKKGKDLRLKAAFYKATNKFYRDAFNKWKSAAALLEVIRFNNEEGPVRMETNLIKQDIANLRRFIKDRGLYTERELNDLLAYDDACYRGIAEKALCRVLVHRDGQQGRSDHWALPYCIDKLKRHTRMRKLAREKLNIIVNALDPSTAAMGNVFYLWRRRTLKKMESLNFGKTQKYLTNRCHDNQKALISQTNIIEDFDGQIGDLKHQREYLIDKVVIGQRLALGRLRFSIRFSKEKAWSRWKANHKRLVTNDYDGTVVNQMDVIRQYKQRIINLEHNNGEIAEQNEGLREGALEGVHSLEIMEKVQKEVQDMHQLVAQQAETMKQLMEQNQILQLRLDEVLDDR